MGLELQIGAQHRAALRAIDEVSLSLKDQRAILASLQKQYAALSTEQTKSAIGKELASDIRIARTEIKRLEAGAVSSFGAVGNAANKGFGAIRQLAYILPGFGIAGIIGLLSDSIGKLASELFKAKGSFDSFRVAQESLSKAFKDSSYTKAVVSIKELSINIDLAKRGFLDKKAVLKQYNDTLGDSLGKVNSLDEAEKNIVKNGEAFIRVTLLKAAANITLNKAAQKYAELQDKTNKSVGDFLSGSKEGLTSALGKHKEFRENQAALDTLYLTERSRKEEEQFQKLLSRQKEIEREVAGGLVDPSGKAEIDALTGLAAGFLQEAAQISKLFKVGGEVQKIIKKDLPIIDLKLKAAIDLEPAVNFVRFRQVLLNRVPLTFKEAVDKAILEANQNLAKNLGPENNPIIINAKLNIEGAKENSDELNKQLEQVNQAIEGALIGSFTSIGDTLGTALAGGDLQDAFQSFATSVGDGVQAIGKELIRLGVVAVAVNIALKSLFKNPALLIAAGVGLVAAGAALKKSLGGGLPRRATGGAVAAGQTVLVGERGQEIFQSSVSGRIIPNNQLSSIQGSAINNIRIEVAGMLKGQDLKLQVARVTKSNQGNV